MKTIITILALCAIAAGAAEPTRPKPLSAQERAAQRRVQNTNAPAIKLGPQFQVQVSPGVMVTIKSTNTFTSQEAARWLRQAALKIQTGR